MKLSGRKKVESEDEDMEDVEEEKVNLGETSEEVEIEDED